MAVPDDTIGARDSKIGRMTDISQGGMGVNFILDKPFRDARVATLISRSKDLPVRFIHKTKVLFTRIGRYQAHPVGLKFEFADAEQKAQVREYISALF